VLTLLHLGNNNIGDEGAEAIAGALSAGTARAHGRYWHAPARRLALLTLDLKNNNLGDAGKQAVRDAVEGRSRFVSYL
jgi:hypothetical protein